MHLFLAPLFQSSLTLQLHRFQFLELVRTNQKQRALEHARYSIHNWGLTNACTHSSAAAIAVFTQQALWGGGGKCCGH